MCYHKRIVFACKHFSFGPEVRPCTQQQNYNSGLTNRACDTMNAHPLHSIGVEVLCEVCEKKRQTTKMTMEKLKMRMKDLSEIVGKYRDDDDDEKSTTDETGIGEVSLVEEGKSADIE